MRRKGVSPNTPPRGLSSLPPSLTHAGARLSLAQPVLRESSPACPAPPSDADAHLRAYRDRPLVPPILSRGSLPAAGRALHTHTRPGLLRRRLLLLRRQAAGTHRRSPYASLSLKGAEPPPLPPALSSQRRQGEHIQRAGEQAGCLLASR